jgi:hypothetical protein
LDNQIDLQILKIYLPDGDSKSFMIYHSIAELFGEKHQYDAVKKLRYEIRQSGIQPVPKIYFVESLTGIRTSNPSIIFQMIQIIDKLSVPAFKLNLSSGEWSNLRQKLLSWKSPKKQKWQNGDVFSIKLLDGTFAFGQVLSDTPTVALFDLRNNDQQIVLKDLDNKCVLTIVHITANSLNNGTWKVIGNHKILADKDSGPYGAYTLRMGLKSFSSNVLESICNYYWFKISNWTNEEDLNAFIMK